MKDSSNSTINKIKINMEVKDNISIYGVYVPKNSFNVFERFYNAIRCFCFQFG